MVSVINKFEIDRNPSASADLSFFPMEISQNVESRVSSDPESRVSVNGDRFDSPSPDSASGSRVSESDELSLSSHGFKTGDMVWGKVKSHPWWPGHIYDESFASPSVRRTKHEGLVLVAFFGDSSYGWFDPAELIPYASNFIEKSKQTTARSFVKAVEESVDESSRRAALGLSCMCRNPYNFRPAHVPSYFAVDVPGFERGGLYSTGQIERSREEFDPAETLTFLRRIALAPSCVEQKEQKEIEVQRTAQLLALRKAWFEEFDETYAQAFGVQPVRPAQDKLEDEPEKFAPRVAPLSGPLVIAEALGDKKKKKNSYLTRASSVSSSSSKKNKYLLKRRDQVPTAAASSLPDAYFGQQQQQPKLKAPSLPGQTRQLPSFAKAEVHDYVLQKREPEVPLDDRKPKPMSAPPSADMEMLPATDFPTPVLVDQKVVAESKQGPVGTNQPKNDANSVDRKPKKEKVKKRPREDCDDKGEVIKKKKKKRKLEQLGQEITMRMENAQEEPVSTSDPNVPSVSTPELDLESLGPLELPELLTDLSALAMDPFHGVDRDSPSVVRHVFLKFRSLVYQKSLVLPAASEGDGQELQPSNPSSIAAAPPPPPKEAKEKREVAPKVKLGSLFKRSLDPTKIGRKRTPSDRQEEMSAKRLKKLNQLKLLSSEKKAVIAQTTPQGEKESNLSADTVRKPENQEPLLPLPPKKESPTNLILKFPPRSTLPSVANLKARFARFGPIAVERCRVLWNTHSCRVQFKYKVDALEAYNYVKDNNLFGQIKVVYSVREVELPGSQSEQQRRLESQPGVSSQFRSADGSGGLTAQPGPSYQRQHSGPLKSILKKPGDDAGKENQRVKFRLATDDSKSEPTPAALSVSFSNSQPSSLSASKSASVLPPLKPMTSLPPSSLPPSKSTTFLPPSSLPPPRSTTFPPSHPPLPRPMPAQPSASLPPRMFESQHLPPPSQLPLSQLPLPPPPPFRSVENRPPMTQYSESHLRQQVQQYGGGSSEGVNTYTNNNTNVDISRKMLSLMNRCNEIVTSLQSLPGFVPFRPL